MKNRMFGCVVAMTVCVGVVYAADPPIPTIETQAFLDNHTGSRLALSGTRVVALYGVPFEKNNSPCPGATCTPTDDFVSTFVTNNANADAFGVANATLVADNYCTGAPADKCTQDSDCDTGQTCDNQITIRNGKFTVYSYIQHIENLPVHGSKVNIPVLHMPNEERIGHVVIRLVPHPASPLPSQNEISATTAINIVSNSAQYQHLTDFSTSQQAEKVVFEASDETLHRAWRFMGWDDDEAYHFFVDTTSQAIAGAQSLVADAGDIKAKVTGLGTPGTASISPGAGICIGTTISCSDVNPCVRDPEDCQLDTSRLPVVIDPDGTDGVWEGMQVELFDDTTSTEAPESPLFTDSIGEVTFSEGLDDNDEYTLDSILEGPWVKVINNQGSDLKATASHVTPTAPPANPVDLIFNPDGAAPVVERTTETAQVNAFTVVNKTHDWFLGLQPTFTGINVQVTALVETTGAMCGGVTTMSANMIPRINLNRAGYYPIFDTLCTNGAFSTVISHEYGHGLLGLAGKSMTGSYGEGFADTIATLLWDTNCFAEDVYQPTPHDESDICFRNVDGVPSGFDGDSTLICPQGGCEVFFGGQLDEGRSCINAHCRGLAAC